MRIRFVVLSLILVVLGLGFISLSRVIVTPEAKDKSTIVSGAEVRPVLPTDELAVEGNLVEGDRFKVYFTLSSPQGPAIPADTGVIVNVTDPTGQSTRYDIEVEARGTPPIFGTMGDLPQGVANQTGTYKVSAVGWQVKLNYLVLLKIITEQNDSYYPNSSLLPVGITTIIGGAGVSILGTRKQPRRTRRSHLSTTKR